MVNLMRRLLTLLAESNSGVISILIVGISDSDMVETRRLKKAAKEVQKKARTGSMLDIDIENQ